LPTTFALSFSPLVSTLKPLGRRTVTVLLSVPFATAQKLAKARIVRVAVGLRGLPPFTV
jgi:hypothetical protein